MDIEARTMVNRRRDLLPVWFFILAIVALSTGLNRGFILDEYKTWMDTLLSPSDLLQDRLSSGHFPTYFMLAGAWAHLAGTREWVLRLPNVLMVAAGIFPLYFFVLRTFGKRTAVLALLLFCFHQLVLWIGQTARPYAGLLLFSITGAWGCAEWWNTGRRRFLAVVSGSTFAAVSFMPLGALSFVAFIAAALLRFRHQPRRVWPLVTAMVIPLLLLLAPALVLARSQAKFSVAKQHSGFHPLKAVEGIADLAFGDFRLWGPGRIANLAMAMLLLLLYGFSRGSDISPTIEPAAGNSVDRDRTKSDGFPAKSFLLWWFFLPALSLAAAQAISGKNLMSQERYYSPCLGAIIVVFAAGLSGLWVSHRRLAWVAAAGCLFLMVPTSVAWWRDPGEGPPQVAHEMEQLENGHIPAVAGHVRWLLYELHGKSPGKELFFERGDETRVDRILQYFQKGAVNQTIIHYNNGKKLPAGLADALAKWADEKPFWLFIYLNEKDALDQFFSVPPPGFELDKKLRFRDARAGYFIPKL